MKKRHLLSVLMPKYQSTGTRLRCGPLKAVACHSGSYGSDVKTQGQSQESSNGGGGRSGVLRRLPVSCVLGHLVLAHSLESRPQYFHWLL